MNVDAPVTLDLEVVASLRRSLAEARARIQSLAGALPAMEGRPLVHAVTQVVDDTVRRLAQTAREALGEPDRAAAAKVRFVAVGSYGRRELCPHSDIDLLMLLPDPDPCGAAGDEPAGHERFLDLVLYGLWDLGFEIGHSVRTVSECIDAATAEQSILSSLLDARLIESEGPDPVFRALELGVDRILFRGSNATSLILAKLREAEQRAGRYGGSVYLLEPNVKESRGGLRELHNALWIARARWRARSLDELRQVGVLSARESRNIERAYAFLLRVRSELHLAAQRRQDTLQFRFQELVATSLGFRRPDAEPHEHAGTERFMRAYYFHAHALHHHTDLIVERATHHRSRRAPKAQPAPGGFRLWNGTLTVAHRDQFKKDPSALIRIFRVAEEESVRIYSYTKDLVAHQRILIDRTTRRSPKVVGEFLALLESPASEGAVLLDVHNLGLLRRLIPEWSRVTARWQQSLYHVFTVDVHSLEVVRNLKRLRVGDLAAAQPFLGRLMAEVPRPAVLYMAALLHDVGKGWPRGDHSVRGAQVAQAVGERFEAANLQRWTARETADLVWLVLHHLKMSDIAQRRDVSDRHLVQAFADEVGSVERLTMLYLLTFADMLGTSPKVWTDWKGSLLRGLYDHTVHVLREEGEDKHPAMEHRRQIAAEEIIEAAVSTERTVDRDLVDAFIAAMPARYMFSFSARQMVRHVLMWRDVSQHGGMAIHIRQLRREDTTRLTVVCRDRPGVLAEVCGVLAAHGIDILSASIFSLSSKKNLPAPGALSSQQSPALSGDDGPHQHVGNGDSAPDRIAVDVLYVKNQSGRIADDARKWDQIRETLERVVLNHEEVVSVLRARRRSGLQPRHRPMVPTRVTMSNHDSQTETVVDVFGPDHLGALHTIARALTDEGLTISLAKISTQGDRLADGFYVTDAVTGQKLVSPGRMRRVQATLTDALQSAV